MTKKGFYFVNSDIDNKRAHTAQILSTVEFVNSFLPLELIFPRYGKKQYDLVKLFSDYGLAGSVPVVFLSALGAGEANAWAFLFFNISASLFLLKKKINKQVDFIYLRSSLFLPLAVWARFLGIPFFYEAHRKPLSRGEKFRDDFLVKRAAGLIVISVVLKDHYAKQNKHILVAHDAVSLERFSVALEKAEARRQLGLSPETTIGVYQGAVSKLKGLDTLFSAARNLPAMNFEVVGPVAREFSGQDIPPNVRLAGNKSQKEVPLYLKAADFLIIPHPDNEYSQSPMKLFEYLAAGRPIISADLANIREVLPNVGNLFFEPGNSESFVAAVKKYIENKETYDREAQQNLAVAKEYTWEKRGEKIAQFIQQSMTKRR